MPPPILLADLIVTARQAVREASQQLDPSIPLQRAAWAIGEIAGKVERDPEIEDSIQRVHRALDPRLNKANQVALMGGLAYEQEDAPAAITALEAALTHAKPNATTIALGLHW